MIQIKDIQVIANYILHVTFDNGETKKFDLKPYLHQGVFKELQNENYLRLVKNCGYFIEWPNEQDLSADTLYVGGAAF